MRRQSNTSLKLLIIATVLLPVSAPASAANLWDKLSDFKKPNLKWGKLELHPYYTFRETYDSNIYLIAQPKPGELPGNCPPGSPQGCIGGVVSSWITEQNLGFKGGYSLSDMHKFDFGYDFSALNYSANGQGNDAVHQAANAGYSYKGPKGISAKLSDTYQTTTEPPFSEVVQRARRWSNTVSGSAEYAPGGPLYAGVDASHTTNKYLDTTLSSQLNRYDEVFGAKLGYQVQPKTRVYVSYHRDIIHYSAGRDANSKSDLAAVGVEGDIAPKVKGQIEAGGSYRQYDSSAGGAPQIHRDASVSTRLTYKPVDRTSAVLLLSRTVSEATFGNNRFYISSLASLGVSHRLPYKLTANVSASAEWDQYPVAAVHDINSPSYNRRDDNYMGQAGLDYDIKDWAKTGISYAYRNRWAKNFTSQYNYDDQRTEVHLSLTF